MSINHDSLIQHAEAALPPLEGLADERYIELSQSFGHTLAKMAEGDPAPTDLHLGNPPRGYSSLFQAMEVPEQVVTTPREDSDRWDAEKMYQRAKAMWGRAEDAGIVPEADTRFDVHEQAALRLIRGPLFASAVASLETCRSEGVMSAILSGEVDSDVFTGVPGRDDIADRVTALRLKYRHLAARPRFIHTDLALGIISATSLDQLEENVGRIEAAANRQRKIDEVADAAAQLAVYHGVSTDEPRSPDDEDFYRHSVSNW